MTHEEGEVLFECGRATAATLLETAVTSAKNPKQLTGQMFVCRAAAIHILAVELYNVQRQKMDTVENYLHLLLHDITDELEFLEKNETENMVLHKPDAHGGEH